ncbi:MAG: RluA family pseudouridine synthase [Planctomycetes bacterium]|nr:RluA family pseudouridine synthase [Planctomycetota bacterium]
MVEIEIGADDAGQRADRWLRRFLPNAPLALVHRLLRQGAVRQRSKRLRAADHLDASTVELELAPARLAELRGTRRSHVARAPAGVAPRIVHEDDALLVVDKPGGLAVQPGSGLDDEHLLAWIDAHVASTRDPRSTFRPAPAHRIDRGTSGLVLIGKSAAAARALAAAFREHRVQKTYLAVVRGAPAPAAGVIDLPLDVRDRGAGARKSEIAKLGRDARTEYRTLRSATVWTLLEVVIETGRTHQIRAHLAELGHPIAGDDRYGAVMPRAVRVLPRGRIGLHAARLAFAHPITGAGLVLDAPLPDDLERLVTATRR